MPAVNDVGEPGAGEPHARFEVAGTGNGSNKPDHGHWGGTADRETGGRQGHRSYRRDKPPRQSPTLQV